ncbi:MULTISPECIES: transporter substrate-binding domain-containing protein [Hyphomicrobiales]|uniref:Polar amino acid transport system substrate-binding protein n=1 Tax=Rhodopseudomonas julia TaxID=200617 RepID=A0ABU0C8X7_9BRAD|nr:MULTISPECIES: transporter substrate-binding domain-containing protein [Hyphomicrobiales]MDQ0326983.1 polar amino acid transport system substrate-binding protein [Rhodopseudomonas julia]
MFKLKAFAIAVGIAIASTIPAKADKLQDILSAGEIRVGVLLDVAPWGFKDENGDPAGLDVDVANLLADDLGVDLKLVQVTGPNRIPSLLADKVDVLVAALGATPERAQQVAFSQPYAAVQLGVYGPADMEKAETPDQLAGQSIAVAKGTTLDLWLSDNAPDANLIRFEDVPSVLSAYMAGQASSFAENSAIVAEAAKNNPDVEMDLKFLIRQSPAHIGIRHGEPDLLRWLDTFLFSNRMNGKLPELQEKWFNVKQDNLPHI